MDTMIAASGEPLPEPLAQRVQAELQPGETLIWTGRPVPAEASRGAWIFSLVGGVMLIPAVIIIAVFGLVLLIVALVLKSFCIVFLLLPLVAVFLVSVAILIAVPVGARRLARNTMYALTNRRAIVWQKVLWAYQVRSYNGTQLGAIQRTERPNGAGDLIFECIPYYSSHGQHLRTVGFKGIARVRDVEDLIRATLLTPPDQAS